MLRIVIFDEPFSVKLRLEGELTDQTAPQLTQRWAEVRSRLKNRKAILDLGDVVEVDQAGRDMLAWLADSGVRFGYAHPKLNQLIAHLSRRHPGPPGFFSAIWKQLHAGNGNARSTSFVSRLYYFFCSRMPRGCARAAPTDL